MSYLNSILSTIDPSVSTSSPVSDARQSQAPNAPKPTQRPAPLVNGGYQAQPLKRKAEGQPDGAQNKVQRKDAPLQQSRVDGTSRPSTSAEVNKSTPSTPTSAVPYRGTAASGGLGATRPAATVKRPSPGATTQPATSKPGIVKKPAPAATTPATASKPTATASKAGVSAPPASGARPAQPKLGGYAAMLAKAKEVQASKPAPPPVKHEPMKVLSKKERMALHAQAKAGAKGMKSGLGGPAGPARAADAKVEQGKEKRKPADLGYQGTARPAKKPADIGYKGTARPSSTGVTGKGANLSDRSRSNSLAAKSRPKADRGRYGGYASWSDEDMDDEEEEDYESDASSDMEGGIWDVEQEERRALEAAKKEDQEALREEMELKRQKEERKRKLAAMSKAAAAKRKF